MRRIVRALGAATVICLARRRTHLLATWLLLLWSAQACVSATAIRQFPTDMPQSPTRGARPLLLGQLGSAIERGQQVGTVQGGMFCVGWDKIRWKDTSKLPYFPSLYSRVRVGDEGLTVLLQDEMAKAGYEVVVGGPVSLDNRREWKADVMVAGVITRVGVNFCYPDAGNRLQLPPFCHSSKGEAAVEVEWHVYERRSRSAVLTVTTGGTSMASDDCGSGAIRAYHDAFRGAVRNLLADGRFVALVEAE